MISETPHPIKKAAALRRALAVASNKMNTRIVLGDTLASRPSSAIVISRLMGCPSLLAGASLRAGASRTWGCYEERYWLTGPTRPSAGYRCSLPWATHLYFIVRR
jgi:hypothetical protein